MKKRKTVKRGRIFCLIFAVLFLCTTISYCDTAGMYAAETNTAEPGTEYVAEVGEAANMRELTASLNETVPDSAAGEKAGKESEPETTAAASVKAESMHTAETDYADMMSEAADGASRDGASAENTYKNESETETNHADAVTESATGAGNNASETETIADTGGSEADTNHADAVTESIAGVGDNASETETIAGAGESETDTETADTEVTSETEERLAQGLEEDWEDCAVMRAGQKGRAANPTIHREDDQIYSYLDFPCYFKYVTGHGQDIGGKTLAVYCVYNNREAPQDEPYKPDTDGAFSKEITYCLYNGCRYKGKTAYNASYSTGNWKKDYYITQIAIHLINAAQGRESSIEDQLNQSSDPEVYQLVQKMMRDAYADGALTSSDTNQTREVNYTVTPAAQEQWVRQADGSWRTAQDYTCQSNYSDRIVSVKRILREEAPEGVSVVVKAPNDPLSSFYLTATPAAYRQISEQELVLTVELQISAEEYGGWWYEPVKSSVKRQYVTFLTMEATPFEGKEKASATAKYLDQTIKLTIYKEGNVLTGSEVTENGVTFQYTRRRLKGTVFKLTAGEEIRNGAGEVIWKANEQVGEWAYTNEEGTCSISGLYSGTYYLSEVAVSTAMTMLREPIKLVLTPENDQIEVTEIVQTVFNYRQETLIRVNKEDSHTKKRIKGAVFGIYADQDIYSVDRVLLVQKGTLLKTVVTDERGQAKFPNDLPISCKYKVKELQAPKGYVRSEEVFDVYVMANVSYIELYYSHLWGNERCQVRLKLKKKDAETGASIPQGDASLTGAVYGLYAKEAIEHPNGITGTVYQKDQQVAVLQIDEQGEAMVEDLYLGTYYLKELKAPEGYVLDETAHEVIFAWENDQKAVYEQTVVLEEQVKKQAFQIIKGSAQSSEQLETLEGAGFTAWLLSDLQNKDSAEETEQPENGYDTTDVQPVVIGPNGETELFTDQNGYLCTIPLPYGTYLVRETTVPKDHKAVSDFLVTVSEHSPNQPQIWRILLDECFMAKLKIIKKDQESGNPILKSGAEFRVKNLDTGSYVEQETVYPEQKLHTSYFTNEAGYLILPEALPPGHYQIEEITAPEGYLCSKEPIELTIGADQAFLQDYADGELIVVQEVFDTPIRAQLKLTKRGNLLDHFDGVFHYEESMLAGAEFELLAEEDIWYPDGSAVCFAAGTSVAAAVTDSEGAAEFPSLLPGTYRIREKQAPFGFLTAQEGWVVTLSADGQEVPVIEQEQVCYNERQKLQILIQKTDQESQKPLCGAVFGLYAAEAIRSAEGSTIVQAGQCLGTAVTDAYGLVLFDLNLPHGLYFVKEEQAPEGYGTDPEQYEIDLRECDNETAVVSKTLELANQMTTCEISKTDLVSGEEVIGAVLELRDEKDELVERWTSGEVPHRIRGLKTGTSYTLTEQQTPYGYLQAESVTFTVKDDGSVQKVEMKDARALGRLRIKKEDAETKEPLQGAVFELRDANGTVLEKLITDANGEALSSAYEIGTYQSGRFQEEMIYFLQETEAPDGYQLDDAEYEVRFADGRTDMQEILLEKTVKNTKLPIETETETETESETETETEPKKPDKAVQTGDHTDLFGLLCAVFLSGEALLALFFFRRKLR